MNTQSSKKTSKRSKILIGIGSTIIIIFLLVGFGSGQVQFWLAKASCGKNPIMVIAGSNFAGGYGPTYLIPDDALYEHRINYTNKYFCTEEEAKSHGYQISASSMTASEDR